MALSYTTIRADIVICQGGLCTEHGSPNELLDPNRATPSIFSSFISQHTAAGAKMAGKPAATAAQVPSSR